MPQILNQGMFFPIQKDTVKQDKLYSNVDLSLQDYQTTHTCLPKVTMKQCFYPYLNTNVSSCLKVIGILKKVLLLLSLIGIFTLLSLFQFQEIGLNFVLAIMVMALIVVCCGLLFLQTSRLLYIESCIVAKYLPQIWQI